MVAEGSGKGEIGRGARNGRLIIGEEKHGEGWPGV